MMEFEDRFHFFSPEEEEGEFVFFLNLLFDAILMSVEFDRRNIPERGTLHAHVGKEFDVGER